jgi:hypothetical protein
MFSIVDRFVKDAEAKDTMYPDRPPVRQGLFA